MKTSTKIVAVVLLVLLAAAAYGLLRTGGPMVGARVESTTPGEVQAQTAVDQAPLLTAQRLAALVTAADEQGFAQDALRIADYGVELQFAQALHDVTAHPPVLSAEAKEIQGRLQAAEKALEADKAQVAALTSEDAKARGDKKDALDDELELAKSQQEVDQYEVDDAKQDLVRVGGDPQARIQQLVDAHKAAAQNTAKATAVLPAAGEERGLIHRLSQWRGLRDKERQLSQAKSDAETRIAQLSGRHKALDAQLTAEKTGVGSAPPAVPPSAPSTMKPSAPSAAAHRVTHSHDEATAILKNTKRRAVDQQALATFDKRIDNQKDLAEVYTNWSALIAAKERATLHMMLIGSTIILVILLVGLVFDGWLEKLLGKTSLDRRQVETLRTVTRVSLQILAVLFILLVIFGPPSQLGTFLGLAGAGLTVALRDFIVGFLGWFVLMGKNGIRLGDWVEINGVTGEVVELGMFHTVLLETGNWTDSGHPTGRRVTFTNGFAIENHYFNFSTSGQWLWDELQVVIPTGQDPYPIVAAIQEKVTESTAASSKEAEVEWKQASGARNQTAMTAAPAINVKPVVGGVEISVRYITRANERYQLRAKLYQAAVDLLGKAAPALPAETKRIDG
ncbi:MAG TPA: mechanosensitive ion channel domain-containing protein [Candidatus Acidoferrum sp.]|nr:mechanosensitive ion channel domain-containing protein [Candidatus Acidoferrum sp.]